MLGDAGGVGGVINGIHLVTIVCLMGPRHTVKL